MITVEEADKLVDDERELCARECEAYGKWLFERFATEDSDVCYEVAAMLRMKLPANWRTE